MIRIDYDSDIEDKELLQEYQNRYDYNLIKRLDIERRYKKAVKEKRDKDFDPRKY